KKWEGDAKGRGAKGLAYLRVRAAGNDSSFAKFLSEAELASVIRETGAAEGDLVLVIADRAKVANGVLSDFRVQIAQQMGLIGKLPSYHWVDDFPLFEYDEESNRLYAAHHPFTAPRDDQAFLALADEMRRSDRKVTPK